jgi:hypothetical protein
VQTGKLPDLSKSQRKRQETPAFVENQCSGISFLRAGNCIHINKNAEYAFAKKELPGLSKIKKRRNTRICRIKSGVFPDPFLFKNITKTLSILIMSL